MVVQYDPCAFWSTLFITTGSVVKKVKLQTAMALVCTILVVVYYNYIRADDSDSPIWDSYVHSLLSHAVTLLLVFRSDLAYNRFDRGRQLLDMVKTSTVWTVRLVCVHSVGEGCRVRRIREEVRRLCLVLVFAFKGIISGTLLKTVSSPPTYARRSWKGDIINVPLLTPEQVAMFQNVDRNDTTLLVEISSNITDMLVLLRDEGSITNRQLSAIDGELRKITAACKETWDLRNIQIPFPYVQIAHLLTLLFIYTLPFILVHNYSWIVCLSSILLSIYYFGINNVAMQIQDPFGTDANDFNMAAWFETTEFDTFDCLEYRIPLLHPDNDAGSHAKVWDAYEERVVQKKQVKNIQKAYLTERQSRIFFAKQEDDSVDEQEHRKHSTCPDNIESEPYDGNLYLSIVSYRSA